MAKDAVKLASSIMTAEFSQAERYWRRLGKVASLDAGSSWWPRLAHV
jgi:hypothetical protein